MAFRVAVAADLGELRAADGVERAAALDRGRVEQEQIVACAGALRGEDADQPLDCLRQPGAPLVQRVLAWQLRKQMPELAAGGAQKPAVTRDPHQHLCDAERHDLRVGQLAPPITRTTRQQVVSRAVDTDTEQVEVGVHRWLQSDGDKTQPTSTCPGRSLATTEAVASII